MLRILQIILIGILVFHSEVIAQDQSEHQIDSLLVDLRLPVYPGKTESSYPSIEDEIALIITSLLQDLYLDDIIVLIKSARVDSVSSRMKVLHTVVTPSRISRYSEAIVVRNVTLEQEKIELVDDEGFFQLGNNRKSRYIKTTLTMYSYYLDLKSGESLGEYNIQIEEVDKTGKKSKGRALCELKKRILYECKRNYWLAAEIDSVTGNSLHIPFGFEEGVKKGFYFELTEPERILMDDDQEWVEPPRTVGFATVVHADSTGSLLKICRQWQPFFPGAWALEHFIPVYGVEVSCVPPFVNRYFDLGVQYHINPMSQYDFGGGIHFIRVADSFADDDYGVGFSALGIWRPVIRPGWRLGGKLAGYLDIPFRRDYLGTVVMTSIFSASATIILEFPLNSHWDFSIQAGYRHSLKTDDWTYSEDDESYPATWEDDAPVVKHSGFHLSLGFIILLF